MFFSLFAKEFKYTFKNITFYVLTAAIIFFCLSQFPLSSASGFHKPLTPDKVKNENFGFPYGVKKITEPEKEMHEVFIELDRSYKEGNVYKIRLMLNLKVKLSNTQKQYVKNAMDKIAPEEYVDTDNPELLKVSYKEYLKIMNALDKKLGGSTRFSDKNKWSFLNEPKTYNDAIKEYTEVLNRDRITNAAGREVADYMGITAGLFPVFIAAFILMRDKRSRMQELICSRSVSSITYITSKFAALSAAICIPYFILSTLYTVSYLMMAHINHYMVDIMAFYKYTALWIIPTILFTVSLGMFISAALSSGIAAVPIQFILWIYSVSSLEGNYSLDRFIIRFNEFGNYSSYIKWQNAILINRIFYTLISIILILAASFIWSKKRGNIGE